MFVLAGLFSEPVALFSISVGSRAGFAWGLANSSATASRSACFSASVQPLIFSSCRSHPAESTERPLVRVECRGFAQEWVALGGAVGAGARAENERPEK